MITRLGTHADTPALTNILNAVISIGGTTAYEDPVSREYFNRFLSSMNPKEFLHVAESDDGIQGMQWIEQFDPPDLHVGGIATFARPGTAQRGIGTVLLEATLKTSCDLGYELLVAKIRADNTGGLAYYTKMGFVDHSVSQNEPLKDGTPVDRIIKHFAL
ncbi:MAG: GNAT family N-acetyltransferase [Pseudomonadota bacterium]